MPINHNIVKGAYGNLSDEEKKARGTFRENESVEVRRRKLGEKIFAGPGYQDVPDPEFPLGEIGLKQYFRLAGRALKEKGRLSDAIQRACESYAILWEEAYVRRTTGKKIPAGLVERMDRSLAILKLAEVATVVDSDALESKKNPFGACGGVAALAKGRLREAAKAQV
jgi:hypothetical protein